MNHRFVAAFLLAAAPLVAVDAAAATGAPRPAACVEPTPQRSYEPDVFGYGLTLDYAGCDWWEGGWVTLVASLSRLDGGGETGATSVALCGRAAATGPGGDMTADADGGPSGACDVLVWLDHPPVEVALYRGEITYPWDGGDRTVGFTAVCGPGGCVDLPADPSPALAAARDVFHAVGGDQ